MPHMWNKFTNSQKKFEKEMSRRIGEPSLTPYHELFEIAMERAGYEEGLL